MSQQGENALPSFDLNKRVGRKIKLQKYRRAVVLCVVDMADFDGSLPRAALQELLPGLEQGLNESQAALGYRLVIAASKVDLLPSQATAARLQVWNSVPFWMPATGCCVSVTLLMDCYHLQCWGCILDRCTVKFAALQPTSTSSVLCSMPYSR